MADPLVDKFGGKKRPPKFADEGPPSDSDQGRGSGSGGGGDASGAYGADDAMPGDSGPPNVGGPDTGADPEEQAVDDLSDMLGVGPEDRQDFAAALQTYVHGCIAKALGGGPDVGGSPDMGGEPDMGSDAGDDLPAGGPEDEGA